MTETTAQETRALLVIDLQNDFVHPDGVTAVWMRDRLGAEGRSPAEGPTLTERIIPRVRALVAAARESGVPVYWVRMEIPADDRNLFMDDKDWHPCEPGTWGAEWFGELAPLPGEVVVTKRRHSAFFRTDLERVLREDGISQLYVTGTATQGCVESTVRDACDHDFETCVVDDCCGQMDEEEHRLALRRMGRLFAVRAGSEDLIAAWTAKRSAC